MEKMHRYKFSEVRQVIVQVKASSPEEGLALAEAKMKTGLVPPGRDVSIVEVTQLDLQIRGFWVPPMSMPPVLAIQPILKKKKKGYKS